ncbi:MAG: ABC-2 family transporter protein [Acidobacteriota bacterium]
MARYLRLYAAFLRFSFSRAFEFRFDFYFRVAMDVIFYAVSLGFFHVLYRHTSNLGGWTEAQAYIFVSGFLMVDAIHMTFFSNNQWWLPIFINRGDLDYHLTRPVSSLFMLSLREFAANSFLNLVLAAGLMAWAIGRYPEPLGAGRIALFATLLVAGAVLRYLVRMCFIIPVFWLHSNNGLNEINWSLDELSDRPHQIFYGATRLALLTVLPFGVIVSVPAHALFGAAPWTSALHVAAVVVGYFVVVVAWWQMGLRAYSSASS